MTIEDTLKELTLDYREDLERCLLAEEKAKEKKEELDLSVVFWTYSDARVSPQTLHKFFMDEVLDMPFGKSGSTNYYCLRDYDKTRHIVDSFRPAETEDTEELSASEVDIDLSVFDKVVEVRDTDRKVKKVIRRAAKKPGIHVALIGGPGTGKSLIASCLEQSTRSSWISGTDMTKASLRDELMNNKPRFVIIDELDKYSSKEPVQLLSEPMEDGTLTSQVSGKEAERVEMPINVFATGNTFRFPSNIADRFLVLRLPEYTDEQFGQLLREAFPRHEGVPLDVTERIVEEAAKRGIKSYRRCRSIGNLAESPEDVEWIFDTFSWDE